MFPEGTDNKVSNGLLYVHGAFLFREGISVNTDEFKRRLTAIFSADVERYSRLKTPPFPKFPRQNAYRFIERTQKGDS